MGLPGSIVAQERAIGLGEAVGEEDSLGRMFYSAPRIALCVGTWMLPIVVGECSRGTHYLSPQRLTKDSLTGLAHHRDELARQRYYRKEIADEQETR